MIIADEQNEFGGWLLGEADIHIDDKPALDWIAQIRDELATMANVTMLPRTTVFGYMDSNYLTLNERVTDHLPERPAHMPRQRLWKVRAKQTVLAQGALNGHWYLLAMTCRVSCWPGQYVPTSIAMRPCRDSAPLL